MTGRAAEMGGGGGPHERAVHREVLVLSPQQARQLLARVGAVEVLDISVAATTNDVFRVVTRSHGVFFIKFHTGTQINQRLRCHGFSLLTNRAVSHQSDSIHGFL